MSETDVAEAMLTLSFTRQATEQNPSQDSVSKRSKLLKARARNISETSPGQSTGQGWNCEEAVGIYRKWIADQVTVADYGRLGEWGQILISLQGLNSVKNQFNRSWFGKGVVKLV